MAAELMKQADRDRKVTLIQGAMLCLNCTAVIFIAWFIYYTTEKIRSVYKARTFLDSVATIPRNPYHNMIFCCVCMGLLALTFLLRCIPGADKFRINGITMVLDFLICLGVMVTLNFNYNGLILLLFAGIVTYAKGGKSRILLVGLAMIGYLVADYNLLSIYIPLYRLADYIQYYPSGVQPYLYSIYNIMVSSNIVLFIVYCVYVINTQQGAIEEINNLNRELQNANEQLQEYASLSESMAQTRERNRLAREIHDTLGHTLTGIATGLDACIATIDVAPEQTRQQLQILSQVSREGLNDIRRSVNELRPDALERLSLEAAIRKMIVDMCRTADVQILFYPDETPLRFDSDEEDAIYRVIQEGITNAVRHGKAKKIWITLRRENGEVLLNIHDNGTGAEVFEEGFGTKHIRERIEMLQGSVEFSGKNGFTVSAHIPIRWGENYD